MTGRTRALFSACAALTFAGCSSAGWLAPAGALVAGRGVDRNAAGTHFRVLYSFQGGADGAVPATGLIADKSGNLFGTATNVGGVGSCNASCGSIFELSPPARKGGRWTFTLLHTFTGGKDGGLPQGGVTFGPDGTLYGTANVGGEYGKFGSGVLFQLTPAERHWTEHVLYSFGRGSDGSNPHGNLVADRKGNLYGTTADGGRYYFGTVYEMSPSSKTETVLHDFTGGGDGGIPLAGLAIDRAGRLFGTTNYGGYFSYYCQSGCGTVFEASPPSVQGDPWKFAVRHEFTGGDGALPYGPVMFDRAGNLYGTTFVSQYTGGGTAFELTSTPHDQPWAERVLYRFPEYRGDAANSQAGFVSDDAGNLYATSQNGGMTYKGDVFELIPPALSGAAWRDVILHTFTGRKHGAIYPATSLVFGAGGLLYGTTPYGGSGPCLSTKVKGCGTLFELEP